MTNARAIHAAILAGLFCRHSFAQQMSVAMSPHNLSATGGNAVRATTEDQICVFCHAPHNATAVQPLWNRSLPTGSYLIYGSRAMDAIPGQPTGNSKMCLSCHDGTIALGAVNSMSMPISMSGGVSTMPAGHANIGTDLRDDHPISFRYDSTLAGRDLRLRNPSTLNSSLKLDSNSELQCTTCHDAHNNIYGKFLVMQNAASQLCVSCHSMGTTNVTGHSDCNACHQPHAAPSGPYLLRASNATDTCLKCHDGSVATAPNVKTDVNKPWHHDTASPVDPPDPQQSHTSCTSCHEPHSMNHGAGVAPAIHPNFGRVAGVNASGSAIAAATTEYETCFKCHADGATVQPRVARRIVQNNTRLEFSPSAASFHPVEAPGRNLNVPSLRSPWTTSSLMYCSDCHASDTARSQGGSGPNGPHGSTNIGILSSRYDTADYTSESAASYALCYKCHDRTSLLNDASFKEHRLHIVSQRTPCIACHDSHGIAAAQGNVTNNSNLINFSSTIVQPNSSGQLLFRDTGTFHGTCSLRCHGENHSNLSY
jgi:predicted CXXCH cytochrome family protein